MDNCSFFIKNNALFGGFPTQENVDELEKNGVRYFVNLTEENEQKINPYKTNYEYIEYPIKDNNIPTDLVSFSCFLIKISNLIKELKNNMIFIHCRGGHSRSALVVACLLCHIFGLTPSKSLEYTTKCHSSRKIMRERWRKVSAPQSFIQKKFVYKFFEPFKIHNKNNTFIHEFSNLYTCPIITDLGTFYCINTAYEFHIKEYCKNNKIIENDYLDDKIKIKIMTHVIKFKIDQNINIYKNIIATSLRPLINHLKDDDFWGDGIDGKGKNFLGKILIKLRNKYYEELKY